MTFVGICLLTDDVPTLTRFYDAVLGIASPIDPIHVQIDVNGAQLAIYSRDAARRDMDLASGDGTGRFTLQFGVDDVDREYARLTELGVRFLTQPTTYPWGSRSVQFLDPDGNILTFACRVGV